MKRFYSVFFFTSFFVFLLLRYAVPALSRGGGLHKFLMASLYSGLCYAVAKLFHEVRTPDLFILAFFMWGSFFLLVPTDMP